MPPGTCPRCKRPARSNGSHSTVHGKKSKWFCRHCWISFSGDYIEDHPTRAGYFDIEASSLRADFGHVICWCILPERGKIHEDCIRCLSEEEEKRVLQSFLKAVKSFDILYGYNSSRFDWPFLRTRALHYDLAFPGYGELWTHDLYFAIRGKLSLSRKSLEKVTRFLDIPGKTPLDEKVWQDAAWGKSEALPKILRHCEGDVKILRVVHQKLEPFLRPVRRSI